MLSLDSLLRNTIDWSTTTVVHVGAGSGAVLDEYLRLSPFKVVLVEGDPETAAALQRAARSVRWAHVVAAACATADGHIPWHRYNVPTLNGPIQAEVLKDRFPSLQREGEVKVAGIALSSLLRSVVEDPGANNSTVLVLDVPSQEGPLLASIESQLSNLAMLVIRRCALPLQAGTDWARLRQHLHQNSFDAVKDTADHDSLWPVAVMRFDRSRYEATMLRLRVRELEAIRDEQAASIEELSTRLAKAEAKAAATSDLGTIREHLDRIVKRESLNVIKQLEAFDSVRAALGEDAVLPEFHGWPISADFAAHVLTLLRSSHLDLVIEFGSGTSTAIIARALDRRAKNDKDHHMIQQIAFEHSPKHLEATRGHIRNMQLNPDGIVRRAPLIPYKVASGESFSYYDCNSALEEIRRLDATPREILVLVDGPPSATGPLARYPALDCVLRAFPHSRLRILLDDFHRSDEKEIVERWKTDLTRLNRRFQATALPFEKGACQMEVPAA